MFSIHNATIHDGTGTKPYQANLFIKDEHIIDISQAHPLEDSIDATGLIACPGFIDIHSHTDHYLGVDPESESKILQGVTTEIIGNCGYSPFLNQGPFKKHFRDELQKLGVTEAWSNLDEFRLWVETQIPAINWGTLVGQGTLRSAVLGRENLKANSEQMNTMKKLFQQSLEVGAFGLSTGLIYIPGMYTSTDEIIQILQDSPGPKIYATHMRSEGDKIIESIQEAIHIAGQSGSALQISHLKTAGKQNWHKIDQLFDLIENADLDIYWDRYPYTASQTSLDTCLPRYCLEGGEDFATNLLKQSKERAKIEKTLSEEELGKTLIVSIKNPSYEDILGMNLTQAAHHRHQSFAAFIIDLLLDDQFQTSAIFFSMSSENMERILCHPKTIIASDASARTRHGKTFLKSAHPRTYGTFPKFLKEFVFDQKKLSLEEAVKKMTSLPADRFAIKNRGVLKKNYFADIVLFNPLTISDLATFKEPTTPPRGIEWVVVNGEISVKNGIQTNHHAGQFLRRSEN